MWVDTRFAVGTYTLHQSLGVPTQGVTILVDFRSKGLRFSPPSAETQGNQNSWTGGVVLTTDMATD